MISASASGSGIAAVAAITTDLVREIQMRHDLSPTAAAAVGRLATGAVLFGAALKGRERISLRIAGDGPIGSVTTDAWLLDERTVAARGYAQNGYVDIPAGANGKIDVGGAVGSGSLQVTKSYEVGQPYVGVVPLHSGEIAEDLAAYLAQSEQIPSVVALGVLAGPEGVIAAGGVLAQVLPGADERAVARLERSALAMPPITTLVSHGAGARGLLDALAGEVELRGYRELGVRFACFCTREKVEGALLGMGAAEQRHMADERPQTEATCEFCRKRYAYSAGELRELADRIS